MARYFREDFDRRRDFVTLREMSIRGQIILPGESINKTLFTDRRLRQLYDQRRIGYAPRVGSYNQLVHQPGAPLGPPPAAPAPRPRVRLSPAQPAPPLASPAPAAEPVIERRRLRLPT